MIGATLCNLDTECFYKFWKRKPWLLDKNHYSVKKSITLFGLQQEPGLLVRPEVSC